MFCVDDIYTSRYCCMLCYEDANSSNKCVDDIKQPGRRRYFCFICYEEIKNSLYIIKSRTLFAATRSIYIFVFSSVVQNRPLVHYLLPRLY